MRAYTRGLPPPMRRQVTRTITKPDGTVLYACELHVYTPEVPR